MGSNYEDYKCLIDGQTVVAKFRDAICKMAVLPTLGCAIGPFPR